MSAERRNLVIAAAAIVVAIAALIAVLGGDGDDRGEPTPQGARTPSEAEQQLARDRRQIAQVAARYQRALHPESADNPCRYMTQAAWSFAVAAAEPELSARGCAAVIRAKENMGHAVPLYQAMPLGVTGIEFRRAVPVAGPQQRAPGAIATWRAADYGQVSFVRDASGQWRIAE